MNDLRFSIVTNDPDRALADALRCAPSNKPHFVTLISDPFDINRMRDGTKCTGLFYGRRSQALYSYRDRRMMGGLVGLSAEDLEWIADWVALHLKASAERRRRYPFEIDDRTPQPDAGPAVGAIVAMRKPELENLVLTQRWT